MEASTRPPLTRRLGRLAGLVLIQLVVVLALLEVVARIFDPLGVSYYPETARYFDTLLLEEPIGYRHRPGLQGTFYGAPVSINALGLRDREVGDKAAGEYRVLVLGDSVPFGIGVRYEESFPYRLEVLLNERHPGRRFRTLNLGVPSYNTEQERIQLETLGLPLRPDAAILLFSSNDIMPKLWVFEKRARWYVNAVQRSYAGSLLFVLARTVSQRLGSALPPAAREESPLSEYRGVAIGEYRADSPRWLAIDRALSGIYATLKPRGIPFLLLTQNERPEIVKLLEGVARRERFPLVNLRRQDDPRWAGQDERRFRNSVVDGHPSPLGNQVLAILIAEALARHGIPGRR